jgi:hypothetical protein
MTFSRLPNGNYRLRGLVDHVFGLGLRDVTLILPIVGSW